MKDASLKIINDLKKYDNLYIIGHNNVDCDSYFSSYLLYKVLNDLGIKSQFCILENFNILEEDKNIINDFKIEEPVILKKNEIKNKSFILVDHNDITQSINDLDCDVVLSIDHHIVTNSVKNTYSIEYTSTGLYIYELFKDYTTDPDRIISQKEDENDLINRIKSKLSKNEIIVFELKLKGLSNKEICTLIDKDKKYVENTMFRINKKYKELF